MVPKLHRIDVGATSSRRIDVNTTSFLRHVPAGKPHFATLWRAVVSWHHLDKLIQDFDSLGRMANRKGQYGKVTGYFVRESNSFIFVLASLLNGSQHSAA